MSKDYAEVLRDQLEILYDTLLQQHNAETEQLRNAVLLLQPKAARASDAPGAPGAPPGAPDPLSDGDSDDSSCGLGDFDANGCANGTAKATAKATGSTAESVWERWLDLSERLLEVGRDFTYEDKENEDEEEEKVIPLAEGLCMRKAWNVGLQEASMLNRNRNYRTSNLASNSTLRMNDILRDPSCCQHLVLKPRNPFQLLWSFIGSVFILWDLVTIPLEMFDIPTFIAFLESFGNVTLGFWILDMPTHLIFGREIRGKVELRPLQLAREYVYSWMLLDLLVIFIDIVLLLIGEWSAGWRSARFLRTLRLLRLLRLLRVAKLQQALTLLASRFLSAHAFMVMKVVAGLLMILAINHIIACCWYGIGLLGVDGKSWILQSDIEMAGFAEAYAASIHWALTQFTPATNNIAPGNAVERFFAVWVILLAMGVLSSFISSITSTVSSLRTYRQEQSRKQTQLLRFFNERNLSTDLYSRVQEVVRKQGLHQVRLNEKEVTLFDGVPQRLMILMHEEMYMGPVHALDIWPMWSHFEDQHFFRELCHSAVVEHVATPAQDAFMPGTDCSEVYVIEAGSMQYSAKPKATSKVYESVREQVGLHQVLCLPCFWADWHHRGRLSSDGSTCYYVGMDAEQFCRLATRHGGPLWQYLQVFGIFLIGAIENEGENNFVTDLPFPEEEFSRLRGRALEFAATVRKSHDIANTTNALNPLKAISRPNFSRSLPPSRSSTSDLLKAERAEAEVIVDARV